MRTMVESLKRLFNSKKITEEKIKELYKKNTINETEKKYILEEGGSDVHNINS